jgi:GNAT superfamily N-acetyltransferase
MLHSVQIRLGQLTDIPQTLHLIRELATYERASNEVIVTESEMNAWFMHGIFSFFVAEMNNEIVGISLFYVRYSTWKGPMLYLEDIVVKEALRRKGIGGRLFEATAEHCVKANYFGMTWQVLDWNTSAIQFYKKYNSEISTEWYNGKLTSQQIREASWRK